MANAELKARYERIEAMPMPDRMALVPPRLMYWLGVAGGGAGQTPALPPQQQDAVLALASIPKAEVVVGLGWAYFEEKNKVAAAAKKDPAWKLPAVALGAAAAGVLGTVLFLRR